MAVYWTSLVVCLCRVELFVRVPLRDAVAKLLRYAGKSSRVIRSSHISDHWKEKVLPTYSMKVAQASLKLFFIFLLLFAILLALSTALDYLFLAEATTVGFLSTWRGLLYATFVSTVYFYARTRLLKK